MPLGLPQGVVESVSKIMGGSATQVRRMRASSPLWQLQRAQSDEQVLVSSQRLFEIAARARRPISDRWPEWYDWARGNHWPAGRPRWKSKAVANYIFSSLFSKTALLTDSRPIVKALPRRERDRNITEGYINPMLEWGWEYGSMDSKFMETMAGMLLFGTFFWHVYWDPTLDDGEGMAATEMLDPAYVYPDGGSIDIPGCEFLCIGKPMSLERLARLYPDGDKVEPEEIAPRYFTARDQAGIFAGPHQPIARKGRIGLAKLIGRSGGRETSEAEPDIDIHRALAVEVILKRNEPREVELQDGRTVELQYPRGRHIVFANGRLLEDTEWDLPFFNVVRFRDYMWPLEFWGGGEVEQQRDIQFEMNMQRALISDHFKHFSNGQIIMDKGAVELGLLTNRPGAVIQKKRGYEYKREGGVPLPAGMIQYLSQQQFDFENISGNTDANQGRVPDRISSGKAIEMVAEAAQNRTRLTEREAKESLEDWADMWIGVCAERMDRARTIRIIDPDNQPVFRKITPKMLRRKMDFEAAVGSQILKGRQRLSVTDAAVLFQLGAIDEEALLQVTDFPEARSVHQRVMRRKEMERAFLAANPQLQVVEGGRR